MRPRPDRGPRRGAVVIPNRVRVTTVVEVLAPVNATSSFERVTVSAKVEHEQLLGVLSSDRSTMFDALQRAAETCSSSSSDAALSAVLAADPFRELES